MDVAPQKQIFVVLGMSRSGTSAIARALKALGVDLGKKLLPGDKRNPKGFFEDSDILYKINRGLSNVLNYPWMSVGLLEGCPEKIGLVDYYKTEAMKILQERFTTTQQWGFKDPRTVNLLPFWQLVFKSLHLSDRYIIVMRNPLAAAYSNQQFAKIDIEVGLIIWLNTIISAIEGTQSKLRTLVSYELMLQDPRLQLDRIYKTLSIELALNEEEANRYAKEFIDPTLSHHSNTDSELETHSTLAIAPLCLEAHKLLMMVAQDLVSFDDAIFHTKWQEIKTEFKKIYPIYDYIRILHLRNKELEREMRSIKKSMLWKIITPLRAIKFYIRGLKKRKQRAVCDV